MPKGDENDAPECNGLCVMAHEVLPGYTGVAHAHPDCEKHGDARPRGLCIACQTYGGHAPDCRAAEVKYPHMIRVIPPAGWFHFGTHVDEPVRLEFSEETDEALMPLWERPIPPAECSCGHGWEYHGPEPPGCVECRCTSVVPPGVDHAEG